MPVAVISLHFSRNPSIYFRSANELIQKLDKLLASGVAPNSILTTPLVFRMNLKKIEQRLEDLKSKSIEPISTLMLTSNASQLQS